jgi:multiple sugar transport system permease protein
MSTISPLLRHKPQRAGSRLLRREALECYLFILPAVLGIVFFSLGPTVAAALLSFTDYALLSPPTWIGLANYQALLHDPYFWQSLKVTAVYVSVGLPLYTVSSLLVALLMNQQVRGIGLLRTIFYLPSVISGVAVALLWRWLFNPQFGLLNQLLGYVGIKGPDWLGDPATALPSLIGMGLWSIGGSMLVYLAGLQGIPTDLYEAAEIDGATWWGKFWRITLPLLSPVLFFNIVLGVIGAFQWFTEPAVITNGGPENATLSYTLYLYRNAFSYLQMGYASALAWILFGIVLVLTLLVFRSSPLWVYYEAEKKRG